MTEARIFDNKIYNDLWHKLVFVIIYVKNCCQQKCYKTLASTNYLKTSQYLVPLDTRLHHLYILAQKKQ